MLPAYLELSMKTFNQQQDKWRDYMNTTVGEDKAKAFEEQIRKNMSMFEDTMKFFTPFVPGVPGAPGGPMMPALRTGRAAKDGPLFATVRRRCDPRLAAADARHAEAACPDRDRRPHAVHRQGQAVARGLCDHPRHHLC